MNDSPRNGPRDETTVHVHAAKNGDRESLGWLVERFSPWLVADARYRLPAVLRKAVDPEDVVADVWAVALPRLPDLDAAGGRHTPVVMKFLATTLFNRVRALVRKHAGPGRVATPLDAAPPEAEPAADVTAAAARAIRRERGEAVAAALAALGERDRELLLLRGVEGRPYDEIAAVIPASPRALCVAYGRALTRLRAVLPGSLVEEFADDGGP